jgi:hypothetical protein
MDSSAVFFVTFLVIIILILISLIAVFSEKSKPKAEYGVKSVTVRGEEVKSIAERRIADYFEKNNINYVYEQKPIFSFNFRKFKLSFPDFYLPDYDVYVEYWGLVNADDSWTRARYVRNMKRKMAIYYQNNIKFISIYPDNLEDLDWIFRRKFKKVTGFELSS